MNQTGYLVRAHLRQLEALQPNQNQAEPNQTRPDRPEKRGGVQSRSLRGGRSSTTHLTGRNWSAAVYQRGHVVFRHEDTPTSMSPPLLGAEHPPPKISVYGPAPGHSQLQWAESAEPDRGS
ncbi:hypothetical protein FQA47_007499 [Oryzias melastigma]|uniref:Uncharacterized protein n=1 Tax=Oryzias melastigma TaxID=30732 RepID=A0A834BSH2_ORYME|nr:hypothetical protein FQA47_007499 [Oryzias melastigma]